MIRRIVLAAVIGVVYMTAQYPANAGILEYTAGHADIGLAYEGGELELHYHFGNSAVLNGAMPGEMEVAPNGAYVRVSDSPLIYDPNYIPGVSQYDFTGRTASDTDLWVLPQSNTSGVPFLGIATEELAQADWVNGGNPITYQLDSWTYTPFGTGDASRANFSLYYEDFLTPDIYFATSDGVDGADSFTPAHGHAHYSYGFTEQGVYGITITAFGTHVNDGFKSSTDTFYFVVGDNTPGLSSAVPEPTTIAMWSVAMVGLAMGLVVQRRRKAA